MSLPRQNHQEKWSHTCVCVYTQVSKMTQNNLERFKKYVAPSNVFNLMDKQDTSDSNLNYNTILDVKRHMFTHANCNI